jgi:carbon starvation protein
MAYIFSAAPFMKGLMSYWYHFAIMFEAVFILTAVDTGTRVGRFLLQEMIGKIIPQFMEKRWIPGIIVTSFLFTGAWGYLVFTGDITTIWPLFGMSNQLLAASALIICTIMLLRMGKSRYSWITAVPGVVVAYTTLYAGYLNITMNYLPKGEYLLTILSIIIMALVCIVFATAVKRVYDLMQIRQPVIDRYGDSVMQEVME